MAGNRNTRFLRLIILVLFLIGVFLIVFSVAAERFGLNLTTGFGLIQMTQLLVGLTCVTLAGFFHVYSLRPGNTPRSLQADIGVRLAATGLVFGYVSGFSDLLGIGTHLMPNFERAFVGPLQIGGLLLGVGSIVVGLVLYYTSRGSRPASSLKFLIDEETGEPSSSQAG